MYSSPYPLWLVTANRLVRARYAAVEKTRNPGGSPGRTCLAHASGQLRDDTHKGYSNIVSNKVLCPGSGQVQLLIEAMYTV
jgi:hypothetical protein